MQQEIKDTSILATGINQGLDINGNPLVYFDSAATNHKPKALIYGLSELYSSKYGKTEESHFFSPLMTKAFEETMAKAAKMIGANATKFIEDHNR